MTSANGISHSEIPEERIDPLRLFTFLCMTVGMFMAILDIQIVSASLNEIQAGLSASPDEISRVQTSYLIAEVVMIPLSGFLSRALGTRLLFTGAAAGFTFSSLMCGFSTSLNEMIFWRIVQGFIGGGMIPTVFASAYTIFPRSKMPIIAPMIGLIVTLAPTIGPTVGGYLTNYFSWHWLFFINIIPGICVTTVAFTFIDFDRPDFSLFRNFDWIGLASMASFLGALEFVLEEGPRNDWFSDEAVLIFTIVSALSAIIFFTRVLITSHPIVDITPFTDRNFAMGSLFSFCLGIGLYGLTYLYPVYLGAIRGHNALMIGQTMFITGLAMFFTAPIVGKLIAKVDLRYIMMVGFVSFGIGTWWMTYLTHDWDFWELVWPQIFRGFGLMMAMIPINNISLGTLPPERVKNASGLFNLTRNLGGAVGLAILTTVLGDRTDQHITYLREKLNFSYQPAMETYNSLIIKFQDFGVDSKRMALQQLSNIVHRESVVLAFSDVFWLLTILSFILLILAVFMKKPIAQN